MNKLLILLLALIVIIAGVGYGVFWLMQKDGQGPAPVTTYGGRASDFIKEFSKYDADKNGEISYEEFQAGYVDFQLNKSEREVYDVKEAFKMLDINHDGSLDKDDIAAWDKKRDIEDESARREKLAKEGRLILIWNGAEIIVNPTQRDWFNAEQGAANRGDLPYAGSYFDRKWFGTWEEEKRAGNAPLYHLKKAAWGRVTMADGKTHEGFVRETKDAEAAKKEGLAAGKVYVLTYDTRLNVFAADKVQAIDYFEGDVHVKYLKAVSEGDFSETAKQLELARQCVKDGLAADAITLFKRVLVFQYDNKEALEALGYKLNGYQYVKVK